jgi:alpha-ketoglutarate-dependent taurine dioxygenase
MDEFGVLVFRNQQFTNDDQLDFAQRFDGTLHAKTSVAVLGKNRFGNEALTDISNVNEKGEILAADDRRRASTVSNRLWHTDASFEDPAGRYSMLSARVLPPVRADTEFADMRAAHDALDEARRSAGARIVSLAPGVIDTDMQRELRNGNAVLFPDRERYIQLQATGALTSPSEAARQVLAYLHHPEFGSEPVVNIVGKRDMLNASSLA